MKSDLVIKIIIVLLVFVESRFCAFPSSIPRCPRDNNLGNCIKGIIELLRPKIASGNFGDEFKTVAFDPIRTEAQGIHAREYNMTFKDFVISGPTDFNVVSVKPNLDKLHFDFLLFTPLLTFTGKYEIRVEYGMIKIQGNGDVLGKFTNTQSKIRFRLKKETLNGVTYVRCDRVSQKLKIEDGIFTLKNLFNGDPLLGEVGNNLINSNKDLVLQVVTPSLERGANSVYTSICQSLFKDVRLDEMFSS